MTNEENLETKIEVEKPSLYDFTRKSVVGAFYRVGTSFTIDAIYLSALAAGAYYASEEMDSIDSVAKGFSDFIHSLDPLKLLRVAGFVVGINFIDYKFDVTNKLDNLTKKAEKGLGIIFGVEKRKGKEIYAELKLGVGRHTIPCDEEIKTKEQFLEMYGQFLPVKLSYIKVHEKEKGKPFKYKVVVDKFEEGFANNYRKLTDFYNRVSPDYNFLDYFYESDLDKRNRIENKFTFKSFKRNSAGTWWMSQTDYKGDEEIYLIQKI